jgi:hypothetical protein
MQARPRIARLVAVVAETLVLRFNETNAKPQSPKHCPDPGCQECTRPTSCRLLSVGLEVDGVGAVGVAIEDAPNVRNAVQRDAHADHDLAAGDVDAADPLRHRVLHLAANRIPLVLFGMQNRTLGPYLAAIHRILKREPKQAYLSLQGFTTWYQEPQVDEMASV